MRALVADPAASPALSLTDVPEPAPGPGQLLLEMEAASVNRGEIRSAAKQPPGTVIGWDVAGTVAALGEGVATFDVGERVVALSPGGGSFAERVVVPAEWTAPLPAACDFVTAAALPVAGVTAASILRLARAHAGDRVLVTGAAGDVGQFTLQLALQTRATVTGQAGSEERAAAVRATGAEALVHPGDGSPVDGEFDVVLDGIGGPMLAPLLDAGVRCFPTLPLLSEAWTLRANVSATDACYVALARDLRCPLVTRDLRLSRTPGLGVPMITV